MDVYRMAGFIGRYREYIYIVSISIVLLCCAYFPIYRNYQRAPTDRYYFGAEEFPIDQLGNLAYVRQGYLGEVFARFNYSIFLGDHPSIVKFEYIVIGHLARLLRTDPIHMFRISQFVLSLGYMAMVYILIRSVIPPLAGRVAAYILVLFGSGIVLPSWQFSFPDGAIYDVLVFQRMTIAMPHYLLGGLFSFVTMYLLARVFVISRAFTLFVLALISGILVAFFYAPDIILIVSSFPLFVLLSILSGWIRRKKLTVSVVQLGVICTYAAVVLIPVLYVRYIVGYYWQDLNTGKMEFLNPFVLTFSEYLFVMGVPYILSIVSLPIVLKKGSPLLLLLWTWTIMHPVGEFVLSKFMHINPIRYMITPYYVAFGVLSGVLLAHIVAWAKARFSLLRPNRIYGALLILILGTSIFSYQRTVRRSELCFCQPPVLDFGYPAKTVMRSIDWLRQNTKTGDIVLSGYHAGMLIPAFAGNRVYTSWWYKLIEPPSFPAVLGALSGFYRQTVDDAAAYTFLQTYDISYVYYSPEEHALNPSRWGLKYPFLSEVYNEGDVIIYRVKL